MAQVSVRRDRAVTSTHRRRLAGTPGGVQADTDVVAAALHEPGAGRGIVRSPPVVRAGEVARLPLDPLVDALPVRGATDVPRMLTFRAGEVTVDVEVTAHGLMGQLLPPQPARIEVLGGPRPGAPLTADDLGRFTGGAPPSGPFALRLRTGGDVVVTEWLRAWVHT
ncbi:hypothetical protein [Streptomyces sp. NPDC058741]|uniref:hypothetical protein n=1 Tax=Streptomyces sp. NPDC058741 TaxID=3346620 RepID=UPI0036B3F449